MERQTIEEEPARVPGRFTGAALAVGAPVVGVAVAALAMSVGLDPSWLLGAVLGGIVTVVVQRAHLTWFASTVRQAEGAAWMDRLPIPLWILRRPLRAIEQQLGREHAPPVATAAGDQVREVTVDRLEMEVHTLDRALDDSRADVAEILDSLDRALTAPSSEAVLRAELPRLRELVRMNVYAQLPNEELALGDVVADVVAGGAGPGRVSVESALPSITAPPPLVEALVRAGLALALTSTRGMVGVRGVVDRAMVVVAFSAGDPSDRSVDAALLRRAAAILGGGATTRGGEMIAVIPAVFRPGIRAVLPRQTDWDPEAI
jgi:hypothetical protein